MPPPLIIDSHEDLAYNILNFGRNYTRSAVETRRIEKETCSSVPEHNGQTLLGWPDYQRGRVAVVFSTLFVTPKRRMEGEWERQFYADYNQAHHLYRNQLETYRNLTDSHPDNFHLIGSQADLETVLAQWKDSKAGMHPVGLVPLMEGAEGVRNPTELETWWEWGVRIIGPAWTGTRFCGGSWEPGSLTDDGRALLNGMAEIGFTLDLSHMDELAARQSLDLYPGPIIASHSNAAAIIRGYEGNRQLSDEVINGLIERDGVIGVVPFCKFLDSGWKRGDPRNAVTLETLAEHIDHICQMAGDAHHIGLGSDFDGGFGLDSVPADVDTIADLQKLVPILSARGYVEANIIDIMSGNWIRHLKMHLPT